MLNGEINLTKHQSSSNRRSNSYHRTYKGTIVQQGCDKKIQQSLSNISTLGRLPLTIIRIFSIDLKLCL